jgi:uncharacterized protein (DUF488 family)
LTGTIHTIGHSTHPIERLTSLLLMHGIDAVADVRSHPNNRRNPQLNREKLSTALKTAGIMYVFLGHELP